MTWSCCMCTQNQSKWVQSLTLLTKMCSGISLNRNWMKQGCLMVVRGRETYFIIWSAVYITLDSKAGPELIVWREIWIHSISWWESKLAMAIVWKGVYLQLGSSNWYSVSYVWLPYIPLRSIFNSVFCFGEMPKLKI